MSDEGLQTKIHLSATLDLIVLRDDDGEYIRLNRLFVGGGLMLDIDRAELPHLIDGLILIRDRRA
jgi:hypothetical protein